MAAPQLENGFVQLACELLAALFAADFPKAEKMMLALLIAAQYGPEKRPSLYLDPIEIARVTNSDPSNIRRAIRNLLACGAITALPDGSFAIVKDWERWMKRPGGNPGDPFEHRVGPGEQGFVAYISALFRAKSPSKRTQKSRASQTSDKQSCRANQTPGGPTFRAIQTPGGPTLESAWPGTGVDASAGTSPQPETPQATCDRGTGDAFAGASEYLRREEREKRERERTSSSSSGESAHARTAARTTDRPTVELSPMGQRLHEWVRSLFRQHEYGEVFDPRSAKVVRGWLQAGGDPEWCAQAFQAAIDHETEDPVSYARKILRQLLANQSAGEVIVPPAFCDFKADPGASLQATPATPAAPVEETDEAREAKYRDLRSRLEDIRSGKVNAYGF